MMPLTVHVAVDAVTDYADPWLISCVPVGMQYHQYHYACEQAMVHLLTDNNITTGYSTTVYVKVKVS